MDGDQSSSKIKQLGKWFASNILGIIGVIGASTVGVVLHSIWDVFCKYPLQIGAIATGTFLVGFWAGSAITKRRVNERKAKAEREAKAIAEQKAKHDAIAKEFASLNLMQAMSMNIISSQPNGMLTKRDNDRHKAFAERPDVAVITESSENADAVRIALTLEWNALMNMHKDVFDEVWAEKIREYNIHERVW